MREKIIAVDDLGDEWYVCFESLKRRVEGYIAPKTDQQMFVFEVRAGGWAIVYLPSRSCLFKVPEKLEAVHFAQKVYAAGIAAGVALDTADFNSIEAGWLAAIERHVPQLCATVTAS
jgi:hypothetical protein